MHAGQKTLNKRARALLAHPGTQHSYRLAAELSRQSMLEAFCTGFSLSTSFARKLPRRLQSRITRRTASGIARRQLRPDYLHELLTIAAGWFGRGRETVERSFDRNARFQNRVPQFYIERSDAVIAFDTAAWILFKRAKDAGRPTVLDRTIAHSRQASKVYEDLSEAFPEWAVTVPRKSDALLQIEDSEHEQADTIVVASSFTKRTLLAEGVSAAKIVVIPYGVDLEKFNISNRDLRAPKRFLFVGSVTARKGVPLLLRVWEKIARQCPSAELWIAGPASGEAINRITKYSGVEYKGQVPHTELPRLMSQCDALVFPSYFEGFGLVLLEALACGLPIISTDATAASDIASADCPAIKLVHSGSEEGLEFAMMELLACRELCELRRIARDVALQFTWEAYGTRWGELLDGLSPSRRGLESFSLGI